MPLQPTWFDRQVQVDLLAQPPLGPDPEEITDKQHPQQQLGIDRGSRAPGVVWGHHLANEAKVEDRVDPSEQVPGWNALLQPDLVEQRSLLDLPSHHRPIPLLRL